jgi:formiminoglutamase
MLQKLIQEFTDRVDPYEISQDEGFRVGQLGYEIAERNDLDEASLVLVGCDEWRGMGTKARPGSADAIRAQLYKLYHWHKDVSIADAGNVKPGAQLKDTYAALKAVVSEFVDAGKKVIVFGGSHDLTSALYQVYAGRQQLIELTAVDALIDLDRESPMIADKFLLEVLTSEPNYVKHFNLVGFQSYFAYPNLLETIDKLRFDCFRVGRVQERLEETEPSIRSSHLLSFDMNAIAHAYAPANTLSPNGFTGPEACKILQYAGMSHTNQVAGIFNFAGNDVQGMTAMQIAHMVWYYMDGMQKQRHETSLEDRSGYNEFNTLCAEVDTLFLQSRNTGRWWMQMPDKSFIPCSYSDYLAASHNDLPERWLRAQERM